MPPKLKNSTKESLLSVTTPVNTGSYTAISYQSLIDETEKLIEDYGFKIINDKDEKYYEKFIAGSFGNVGSAVYGLQYDSRDPELQMVFSWVNSYDKSTRFRCSIGGKIIGVDSIMVASPFSTFARKHTGNADTIAQNTMRDMFKGAKFFYEKLLRDKEAMEVHILSRKEVCMISGLLFYNEALLAPQQASNLQKLLVEDFKGDDIQWTAWSLYKLINVVMYNTHPKNWLDQQYLVHEFFMSYFEISNDLDSIIAELGGWDDDDQITSIDAVVAQNKSIEKEMRSIEKEMLEEEEGLKELENIDETFPDEEEDLDDNGTEELESNNEEDQEEPVIEVEDEEAEFIAQNQINTPPVPNEGTLVFKTEDVISPETPVESDDVEEDEQEQEEENDDLSETSTFSADDDFEW